MKNNSFFKKNTIIKTNLRTSRTLIIVFGTLWFLTGLLSLSFVAMLGKDAYTISNTSIIRVEISEDSRYTDSFFPLSISSLFIFLLGTPTIVVSLIISIIFLNLTFINEIKTGQISIWMTAQNSKTNIFFSKLMTLWIIQIIVFVPSFLMIIIAAAFTSDVKANIGYVLLDILNMIIIMGALTAFVTMIGVLFSSDPKTGTLINSMIVVYIVITFALITLGERLPNNKAFSWMIYVKYVSIQSLFAQSAHFEKVAELDVEYEVSGDYVYLAKRIGSPMWWVGVAPIINLGIGAGSALLGKYLFKSKELYI